MSTPNHPGAGNSISNSPAPFPPACSSCKWWAPKYHGVGQCIGEGSMHARFWVEEGKRLLTVATFSCQAFTLPEQLQKDTV